MTKMWTSERVLLQVCAGQLTEWASRFSSCDEPQLRKFAPELSDVASSMYALNARSKSHQTPPDELPL